MSRASRERATRRQLIGFAAVVAIILIALVVRAVEGSSSPASSGSTGSSGSGGSVSSGATCALSTLPAQAGDTVEEIHSGGPFPYRQDGVVFDNRERRLPSQSHGFYHEYTVRTPGSPDRGTRRVITGGGTSTDPQVMYYTGNHYASFCELTGAG